MADVTTATVIYNSENTGEASDGTAPLYLGTLVPIYKKILSTDHAGHIIAAALGGKRYEGWNLFSQNALVNNSQYKILEGKVLSNLRNNPDWTATITVALSYNGAGVQRFRPTGGAYIVAYTKSGGPVDFSLDFFLNP